MNLTKQDLVRINLDAKKKKKDSYILPIQGYVQFHGVHFWFEKCDFSHSKLTP